MHKALSYGQLYKAGSQNLRLAAGALTSQTRKQKYIRSLVIHHKRPPDSMQQLRQLWGKIGRLQFYQLMSNWTSAFSMFLARNNCMQDIYNFSFANPNKAAMVTQNL